MARPRLWRWRLLSVAVYLSAAPWLAAGCRATDPPLVFDVSAPEESSALSAAEQRRPLTEDERRIRPLALDSGVED